MSTLKKGANVTLYFDIETKVKLKKMAKSIGESQSQVVRRLVSEVYEKLTKQK